MLFFFRLNLRSANASGPPCHSACLDRRSDCVVRLETAEALSGAWLDLCGFVGVFLRHAWQELLPVADLSGPSSRRRGGDRKSGQPAGADVDETGGRHFAAGGGAFLAPVVVPVLPPDLFIAYTKRLPFKLPVTEFAHARAVLP